MGGDVGEQGVRGVEPHRGRGCGRRAARVRRGVVAAAGADEAADGRKSENQNRPKFIVRFNVAKTRKYEIHRLPNTETNLADDVARLQARVAALEASSPAPQPADESAGDDWWLLDRLAGHTGPGFRAGESAGSLAYGGRVTTPGAGSVVWQLEHPLPAVLDADLVTAANVLGALGHPLRLEILRRLLLGARTLADLQEIPGAGTAGQLHHHLRELRGANLVVSRRRNDYAVPAERVVPVLVMLAAALGRDLG